MGWQWHQLDHMQIICTSLQIITMPAPHHSILGLMLFLTPNQQSQSTEDRVVDMEYIKLTTHRQYKHVTFLTAETSWYLNDDNFWLANKWYTVFQWRQKHINTDQFTIGTIHVATVSTMAQNTDSNTVMWRVIVVCTWHNKPTASHHMHTEWLQSYSADGSS